MFISPILIDSLNNSSNRMKVLQQFVPSSVLVTGANRGLGLAFVKYFVQNNAAAGASTKVISCSRRISPELEELLEDIYHIDVDVTEQESVKMAANKVSDIVGIILRISRLCSV